MTKLHYGREGDGTDLQENLDPCLVMVFGLEFSNRPISVYSQNQSGLCRFLIVKSA